MARSTALVFFALASAALAQVGDVVGVHDPAVIRDDHGYTLVSTGRGLSVRTSPDLVHWNRAGRVFDAAPTWAAAAHPTAGDYFWAPDLSVTNGEYRLYYAVSTFGTNESTIGLATTPTLDRTRTDYRWTDRGPIVATHRGDDWNAIDPAAFTDADGQTWLAAGSFWTGIKLFKVDAATGKIAAGDRPRPIAGRPGGHEIEAAFLSRHGEWVYLWVSFGLCCRGVNSTYDTRVGRSKSVEGPFVDRDGKAMTDGGGTIVLTGDDRVRGPGHSAVVSDGASDFLVHHWYDGGNRGRATLGVHRLDYDADGWPHAGPLLAVPPATQPVARAATMP